MVSLRLLCFAVFILLSAVILAEDAKQEASVEALLKKAQAAAGAGELEMAVESLSSAIQAAPDRAALYELRADYLMQQRKHKLALADYDRLIGQRPDDASLRFLRGVARFKSGDAAGSIADWDRQIALNAKAEKSHWQRGISYYYAGQFRKGQRQFEAYQTYDDNDVENVVWRYLCQARVDGVDKARAAMLKVRHDRRVPMMKIFDLYRGQATAKDVFEEAGRGNPSKAALNYRLFYANLYVGLHFEAAADAAAARKHILEAEKHVIGHYMWDVAHVHAERVRKRASDQ